MIEWRVYTVLLWLHKEMTRSPNVMCIVMFSSLSNVQKMWSVSDSIES